MNGTEFKVGEDAVGHADIAAAGAQVAVGLASRHIVPEDLLARDGEGDARFFEAIGERGNFPLRFFVGVNGIARTDRSAVGAGVAEFPDTGIDRFASVPVVGRS